MAVMVKDGFHLYYEDTGGNAPTLLFLHGAGGNHLSWWQQVPVFAEEYRCVTVDQRGFGQSPWSRLSANLMLPDPPPGPGWWKYSRRESLRTLSGTPAQSESAEPLSARDGYDRARWLRL